jgi:hypothetical protein
MPGPTARSTGWRATARATSPCVGADETSGFRWQHGIFTEALRQAQVPFTDTATPGKHHFNVVDELARADSAVFRALWHEMTLPAKDPT